ncbi:MAG: ABC transporter permease [Gordonia sp. (in: high G+C Gram-positive bacteria)]
MNALAGAFTTLFIVVTAVFFTQALLPGDRATIILNTATGDSRVHTPDELAPINAKYGFDRPLLVQYFDYLTTVARGDLGESYLMHVPVSDVIWSQGMPTIILVGVALGVGWVLALTCVTLTAGRARLTSLLSGTEVVAASLPQYWLAVVLLALLAVKIPIFPAAHTSGPAAIVLPALALAIPLAGFIGQAIRARFELVLDEPFIVTVRTRGSTEIRVRTVHILRHAIQPGLSVAGWSLGGLLSGAVIVEQVFSRPGIGSTLVSAASARDLPLIGGIIIVIAVAFIIINLTLDLIHTLLDPRVSP